MKDILKFNLRFFLYWMLLFTISRTLIICYIWKNVSDEGLVNILASYYHGAVMDLSMICYFLIPVIFLIAILLFIKRKQTITAIINTISVLYIFFTVLITIVDAGLASSWGSLINKRSLSYLGEPDMVYSSVKSENYILLLSVFVVLTSISIFVYLKYLRLRSPKPAGKLFSFLYLIVVIPLIVLGCRGGLSHYPINKSRVYYSNNQSLNLAAVNGVWNFIDVIISPPVKENEYRYFSNEECDRIVGSMFTHESGETIQFSSVSNPNIIVIVAESFSAENVFSLGGDSGIAPGFDRICKDGISFTRFYATGFRTEQGLLGMLCGYPAQPKETIQREPGKYIKLPNAGIELERSGYHLNYYAASNLDYARTREFLSYSGFTKIYEWKDFANVEPKTDYGIYDDSLLNFELNDIKNSGTPFFHLISTVTSHESFDAKVNPVFGQESQCDRYKNCIHYTDSCISAYIYKLSKDKLWNNTIVVITADHAHSYPKERKSDDPERHHIPFLVTGGALLSSLKGTVNSTVHSQTDFPAFLLSLTDKKNYLFNYSNQFVSGNKTGFAFYTFDNGFGVIENNREIVFNHDMNSVTHSFPILKNQSDSLLLYKGKALLQIVMERFYEM